MSPSSATTTEPGGPVATLDTSVASTESTISDAHRAQWSRVAVLPFSLSSGAVVESIESGIVVLEAESTTLVGFDGTTSAGGKPPIGIQPGCCGSAVGIPVGSRLILFDSYAPGSWLLDAETVRWTQVGDRPMTGDVLGSAHVGDLTYVVTASPRSGNTNTQVAALDPATWEWAEIQPVPAVLAVGGVTTDGERLIVAGVQQDGNNVIVGESRHPVAFSYHDGEWTRMPDVPIDGQAATVAWVEDVGLLAWNYDLKSALMDLDGDWESLGGVPMHFSECYPKSAQVDRGVIALFCGQLAHFDGPSRSWSQIPIDFDANYVATDDSIYELSPENGQTTLSVRHLPDR